MPICVELHNLCLLVCQERVGADVPVLIIPYVHTYDDHYSLPGLYLLCIVCV